VSAATAFGALGLDLTRLHDGLEGLRLALVEDRPLLGAGALLDRLGEIALDLEEQSAQALAWAAAGQRAAESHGGHPAARRALVSCQALCLALQRTFAAEVVSYERILEIAALERERKGEWAAWVESVRRCLEQCQEAAQSTSEALFECWKEIADRAGAPAA
jgi:hypothetical protein